MTDGMQFDIDIEDLLDEIGMEFALHTHHPLTHLELGDSAPEEIKMRAACPMTPTPL